MKKLIITGDTGCGKTYNAINWANKFGSFVYIAPCRQLVYESFMDYSQDGDSLATGEVRIDGVGNLFAVYESANTKNIARFDTLILDEAHFIDDCDRGDHLKELVSFFKGHVLLVTATKTFEIEGFQEVFLKCASPAPKLTFVEPEEWLKRKDEGVSSIIFRKYAEDAELTGDTLPSERLALQLAFRKGEINFVSATNVLAQGINMPAENILIEYNEWDSDELLIQKIGRAGRPGFSNATEVTVCLHCREEEKPKLGRPRKINIKDVEADRWKDYDSFGGRFLVQSHEDIPRYVRGYNDLKYAQSLVRAYYNIRQELGEEKQELIESYHSMIEEEALKVEDIIRTNSTGIKLNASYKLKSLQA